MKFINITLNIGHRMSNPAPCPAEFSSKLLQHTLLNVCLRGPENFGELFHMCLLIMDGAKLCRTPIVKGPTMCKLIQYIQ